MDENDTVQDENKKSKKWRNPFDAQQRKEEKERRQKKKSRLIVRNISFKIKEKELREHFEQWGTIEDLKLLRRADGKLVGCAFVQYETVNQATKAILKANNNELLGRTVFVDWALGKDEYVAKTSTQKPKEESEQHENKAPESVPDSVKEESGDESGDESGEKSRGESKQEPDTDTDEESIKKDTKCDSDEDHKSDKDELKEKLKSKIVRKDNPNSNDVHKGCTVFIKNLSFDSTEIELRKACRKYGPLDYAIINKERISGHSKGTAFVKFKNKESADLCLQAGTEFVVSDQVLDPHPALSREEIANHAAQKSKEDAGKDSRNLFLVREGLIMSGSKAAEDVSASDMTRRHKLEQIKTQVLKNLNRFVSRNRLSVHNLPLNYDNEKLKQMAIAYTSFRPHECRVMRESKITPEHPNGKSKGFGFMSFNTHQEALTALRKLNNNPKVFGTQRRPIVSFSIEDRAVYKIKEKRAEKSKLNNPTFQEKLAKRKELRKKKVVKKLNHPAEGQLSDNKKKLKQGLKNLEEKRATVANSANEKQEFDPYVGMAAKAGTSIRMRSNKKINEQAQEHIKRVKGEKRKEKQRKIKQMHLNERTSEQKPKQGRKREHDDLAQLVNKYKSMIDTKVEAADSGPKAKKPKRTKWYAE